MPTGAGIFSTTWSSRSSTPRPVFAETFSTSSGSQPMMCAISAAYFSGWAAGRSILLSTGMMVRSFSSARYRLARVCASMPWAASTTRMVPSQAARERDTSYVKSTWPGVSIMLRMCVLPAFSPVRGAHGRRTAWDLMVMPRSRSMSIRSRYWARICRGSTTPVICSIRSASVDLPWSMWAMMQKLRITAGSVRLGSGTLLGVAGTLVRFLIRSIWFRPSSHARGRPVFPPGRACGTITA